MLFNSFDFLVFFPIFFILFFATKGINRQLVLFISSCIFYAWFIPYYVLILFIAILVDYYSALGIERAINEKTRKQWLLFGIVNTCGLLFIFKYYNFFIDSLNTTLLTNLPFLAIALPIGLSFHTFQGLSYVIDVYRKRVPAEHNILSYANFVIMFPQLVAGPIERAAHLLPQFKEVFILKPSLENFKIGIVRFFYGLFKKLVVADNIAPYVDAVYGNAHNHDGSTLALATILFAFQIYADFSGYSDMAIGLAKMIGFSFNENFDTPFFSKSIAEFWRRWHISLSNWIRDYVYYPLIFTYAKKSKLKLYCATITTFIIVGLWHGANWTYIMFGMLHGTYITVGAMTTSFRERLVDILRLSSYTRLHNLIRTLFVFMLVCFSFIFFRSQTLSQAFYIIKRIVTNFSLEKINFLDTTGFATIIMSVVILLAIEVAMRGKNISKICSLCGTTRNSLLLLSFFILSTLAFGSVESASFIYFQF